MVPKIIHIIWLGENVPPKASSAVQRYRQQNPRHDVRFHRGLSELLPTYCDACETYAQLPQLKADLLRWSLLEKYGGWYVDVDCQPFVSMETIEQEYGLSGSHLFATYKRTHLNNDILAVGLDWPGWRHVHDSIGAVRDASRRLAYGCFSKGVMDYLQSHCENDLVIGQRRHFSHLDSRDYQCPPLIIRSDELQHASKSRRDESSPALRNRQSATKRFSNWRLAIKRWQAAGKPDRSPEEVERIIRECCEPCEHYDHKWRQCKLCGCFSRKRGRAEFNKPKMLTERCPLEPPKWGEDCISESPANLLPVKFTTPMDVVYPISGGFHGKKRLGSKWNDNELRYSLRSLEQYFQNLGRVFIVGHKPDWLTGVVHLPAEDTHRHNKDANLIDKVLLACRSGVSPTFLRLSDDQCLLKPWDGLQVWHMGNAMGRRGGKWWRRMQRTCEHLQSHGRPTFFYDCHAPAPVDRETFIQVATEADYQTPPGMCINTLYFNTIDIPRDKMSGRKVAFHRPTKAKRLRRGTKGKLFLGYSEKGTNEAMKQFLQELFPTPSRFEQ